MSTSTIPEHLDGAVFEAYLARTRWFGGKGRPFHVTGVRPVGTVPGAVADGPVVVLHLVEVSYDDAEAGADQAVETYQVPLSLYRDPEHRLDHAFVGWWQEPTVGWVHAYDALHDREAMACWLRSFDVAGQRALSIDAGPSPVVHDGDAAVVFRRMPGHDLDLESTATLFGGEQSNSSTAFGEDAVLKVFRKVTAGTNPDIEVHEALTRAGIPEVAALYGWVELREEGPGGPQSTDPLEDSDISVVQLGMLQEFLRTATDGFDLALSSVRNLYSEGDLHAHEVGGDFAGESSRLGEALASVHRTLAGAFPVGSVGAADLAGTMAARLDAALGVVPELAAHAERLRALFSRVGDLGELPVQRVHGDLHLGQTMRTASGWKIVDFEGEPAKTLAERVLPDSPWRDVAGMLRSFDYAPHVAERSRGVSDPETTSQIAVRADEWAHRNANHFLAAYAGGTLTESQRTLLDAYIADKAVYECVYETRNRPTWVSIPLAAVARIGL